MADLLKRKGTFKVSVKLIEDNPDAVIEVLKDVLVTRADNDFITKTITYYGYSKHFDSVKEGDPIPEYITKVDATNEPYLVTWHRQKEYSEKDVESMFNQIMIALKAR